MSLNHIGEWLVRIGLGAVAIFAIACGSDDVGTESAEVETWGGRGAAASETAQRGGNRPPEILGLSFEPDVAMPGRPMVVRADVRDPDNDPVTFVYAWKIEGQRIPESGSQIVVPPELEKGARVSVEVVAKDREASSDSQIARTRVANRAPRIEELAIRVVEGEGEDLGEWVADPVASDADDDEVTFRFEWVLNGEEVIGESERLPRSPWKRGDQIELTAWPSDGETEGMKLTSAPFTLGNSPPSIHSRPPGLDPSGRFVYQVEASDRDGDRGLRFALVAGPRGMSVDPFDGKLTWQATIGDSGEHLVTVEVDDRRGGTTRQSFYVSVAERAGRGVPAPAAPRGDP